MAVNLIFDPFGYDVETLDALAKPRDFKRRSPAIRAHAALFHLNDMRA
jgi:hypothetical protein